MQSAYKKDPCERAGVRKRYTIDFEKYVNLGTHDALPVYIAKLGRF